MPREIWYLSLPFHLLSYFSCLTTSPFLISFYFSLLAVLCHCCYFLTETRNLNVYSADHLKKKGIIFSPGYKGSPTRSPILAVLPSYSELCCFYLPSAWGSIWFFPPRSSSQWKEHSQHRTALLGRTSTTIIPCSALQHQLQIVGKLLEGKRICSTSPKTQIEIHDKLNEWLIHHQELFFQSSKSNSRQGSLLSKMVASLQVPR